jgi:hypothetical protein
MPNNTPTFYQDTASYQKLFEVLAEHKAFTDEAPQTVMCDFEKSLVAAMSSNLPWAEVSHFPVLFGEKVNDLSFQYYHS